MLFLFLLGGAGGFVYWGQHTKRTSELYYSGMIEATQAKLAFQTAGRINEVRVNEDHAVDAGQSLAILDQDSALAYRGQDIQQAYALLKEGYPRQESILTGRFWLHEAAGGTQ